MFKKIISAAIALSMVAAFAIAPVNAADDFETPYPLVTVLNYSAVETVKGSNGSIDQTKSLDAYGAVCDTGKTWSPLATDDWDGFVKTGGYDTKLDKTVYAPAFRFSARPKNSSYPNNIIDKGESELGSFNFASSKKLEAGVTTPFNKSAYMLEMDFTAALRNNTSSFIYNFVGDNGTIATMKIAGTGSNKTASKISFNGSDKSMNIETQDSTNFKEIDYLKLFIDMDNQKISAWGKTRGKSGKYEESIDADSLTLLADNIPFISTEKVTAFTDIKIMANLTSTAATNVSKLKISEVDDVSIVTNAAANLTVPSTTEGDLTLPTEYRGAKIKWESSNPDVITNDGKVTQAATDQTVKMTATVTRNDVITNEKFNVTVKAAFVPVPVPEDGVWVNDDMTYASVEDIPMYNNGEVPFGFDLGTCAANGTITTDGDNIILTKTTATNGGEFDLYKYLAPHSKQMLSGKQIVEFAFTPINNPDLYITLSDTTWKGPQTINYTASENKLSWGSGGSNFITEKGKPIKITIALDHDAKKLSAWANDSVWVENLAYRTDGSYAGGFPNVLKLLMEIKNANAANTGVKLDYVRVLENADYYAAFCAKNENPAIDTEIESAVTSIALPTEGEYNDTIAWASDNEAVIAADGTVVHGANDVIVNLTPTYTNKVSGTSTVGTTIAVTVKARNAETTYSDTEVINPGEELIKDGQYAVGFWGAFTTKNTGIAPSFGFKLTYPDKSDMDVKINANLETSVNAGIILTYTDEDGFVLDNLKVQAYVTE